MHRETRADENRAFSWSLNKKRYVSNETVKIRRGSAISFVVYNGYTPSPESFCKVSGAAHVISRDKL